ncbi:MAG: type III pantothenate kinase [Lachnospiraceae bacterium]|nr:type III pantothenate kinase [Lachnospiraceae bacterium]
MLLAIDVRNAFAEIGVLRGEELVWTDQLSVDMKRTESEYAILLASLLRLRHVENDAIDGAIIASVVPPLTARIERAAKRVTGITPLVVGPGVKNGLVIRIDDPKTLGADLVADSVGALARYGAPAIIIDFGTATTLAYLNGRGEYRGGAICPGLMLAYDALFQGTSMLTRISFDHPGRVVGTSTVECMKSGAIYGTASMIDGMIDRFLLEQKDNPVLVATGAHAEEVLPHMAHQVHYDPELMIYGLAAIYKKNR